MLRQGRWSEGERIPSETELSRRYGVCRSTVKKALSALSRRGQLVSRQGKGHYAARPPARPRTWTVGIVIHADSHFDHPVVVQGITGLQQALLGTPYHIKVIIQYRESLTGVPWSPRQLLHREAPVDVASLDALVTHKAGLGEDALRALAEEIPVCATDWRDGYAEGGRLSSVRPDMTGGVAAVCGKLISLGHRRVALCHADVFQRAANADAARVAALSHPDGAGFAPTFAAFGEYTEAEGAEAMRQWLASPPASRPTAFIGSEELLTGVARVAREAGAAVPGDLSLVAINDLAGDLAGLPVNRVRLDHRRVGTLWGEELLRLMEDPAARGREILVPAEWIDRGSAAPPRAWRPPPVSPVFTKGGTR